MQSPSVNLLLPRSPLVGRQHELATVRHLLLQDEVGLLTLTGPGGVGKTRLAYEAAAGLLDHFVDGITAISLAAIRDAALVVAAVAQPLGVQEGGGRPLQASVVEHLRGRQTLLVLDNFEQVLAAAPFVRELLAACPRLKVLVTSREMLHLYGEHEYPIPPLALPDPKRLARLEEDTMSSLTQSPAVALFVQRAAAAKPGFALTPANAAAVAEICIRLDGLPLALELAAAKLKLFPPQELLARLRQRFVLLTGGAHDLPARQRTLADEIAWSYDLLSHGEQALFRRLSVFLDGFTTAAAQAVSSDLELDFLAALAALIDKSLVRQLEVSGGEARFGMLETIREYALEQLGASNDEETARRQHALYMMELAEAIGLGMAAEGQKGGLARLMAESANIQAALAWSQHDDARPDIMPRLAGAVTELWLETGAWSEGRRWLEIVLARTSAGERTLIRAEALVNAGCIAVMQGDGVAAQPWLEEGLAIAEEQGAQFTQAVALTSLGWIAHGDREFDRAIAYHRRSLAIHRALGYKYHIASVLFHIAGPLCDQEDYAGAQALYAESLALFQEIDDEFSIADVLHYMGEVAQRQGDYARAWALYRESLTRWRAHGIFRWRGIATCLDGLAGVCVFEQRFAEAARLFGAAEALREQIGAGRPPYSRAMVENDMAAIRARLGEDALAAAWADGRTLASEQAVDEALALPELSVFAPAPVVEEPGAPAQPALPASLTTREVEVLRLLAQGHSYAEIADHLVISRRTVNSHLTTIYSKLGVTSRTAAKRLAIEYRLT